MIKENKLMTLFNKNWTLFIDVIKIQARLSEMLSFSNYMIYKHKLFCHLMSLLK